MVARTKQAKDGGVVALGAAGVEDDLGFAAIEEPGEGFAGVVDGAVRGLTVHVNRGGVAEVLRPVRAHSLDHLWQQGRCGVGVHVHSQQGFALPT